MTAIMIKYYFE